MPLEIVRNDITTMAVDAIVCAANNRLLLGGGVCGAIHAAAGPRLLKACRALHGCKTGAAKLTEGFDLPARYVIHTVGPIWRGGRHGERELLAACYRNSLALAKQQGCASVAFPLISAGAFGYPREDALRVATDTLRDFLLASDENAEMQLYLVIFDPASFQIGSRAYARIAEYIDDRYAEAHANARCSAMWDNELMPQEAASCAETIGSGPYEANGLSAPPPRSLEDALGHIDESFSQMLLRKIDERGMTDPACYKRANIDRKLFSKIRSDAHYKPKKTTALALAVALRLSLEETRELLLKAGLALSPSEKFDIIVEYHIRAGQYDIFEINNALYRFDQPLLGGR